MNNTAKFTGRGEPETAKVCGELGCTEMEWEALSPKLKCITVWTEQHQVTRDVRTALAGGEFPLSGLSVVQAQGTAVSAHPSFLLLKVQKVPRRVGTSSSYLGSQLSTGIVNATGHINKYC